MRKKPIVIVTTRKVNMYFNRLVPTRIRSGYDLDTYVYTLHTTCTHTYIHAG